MKMLFTGCERCGRSTTSFDSLCDSCDVSRNATRARSRERMVSHRQRSARYHVRNS